MEAEPARLARERQEMKRVAPDLAWDEDLAAGGWTGLAPQWPFDRPRPAGLEALLQGRRLMLRVEYTEAFPMVEPRLWPLDPEPPIERRTAHTWHLNGNGSLCLLQSASDWSGRESAADLVVKASGWFIEYLLLERGEIGAMTEAGIHADPSLDPILERYRPRRSAKKKRR